MNDRHNDFPETFGPYKILRELGQGGMGIVHLAEDTHGRPVALKRMRGDLTVCLQENQALLSRFLREIKAWRKVSDHPHIASILNSGEIEETYFLALEFAPHGSLQDTLDREKQLEEYEGLKVFIDLLRALTHMQEHKLVHRDLKPANILLTHQDHWVLADLGLARLAEGEESASIPALTTLGRSLGTAYYMAPEQVQGQEKLGSSCDLYAAGALLFHILTGRPPFQHKTVAGVLKMHLAMDPPDPQSFNPKLSPAVATLILELLEKDPQRRIQDARSVLERALVIRDQTKAKRPSHTTPKSITERSAQEENGGLFRACLTLRKRSGRTVRYFLYGQNTLQMGRNAVGMKGQDLCLRFPAAESQKNYSISGVHARLEIHNGRTWLTDLHSGGGTTVDDEVLKAGVKKALEEQHRLCLAAQLTLDLTVQKIGTEPAIFLTRPHSGQNHAYLLVPQGLRLTINAENELVPDREGEIEISFSEGKLWLKAGPNGPAMALHEGMTFQWKNTQGKVVAFDPNDQKRVP